MGMQYLALPTLILSIEVSVYCTKCLHRFDKVSTECRHGCCGNGTVSGLGTIPCCISKYDEILTTYLPATILTLLLITACVFIIRIFRHKCYKKPVTRNVNIQFVNENRIVLSTLSNSSTTEANQCHNMQLPPSYENVVEELGDNENPPEYSDLHLEDSKPPEYSEVVRMDLEKST